jgi:ABC-type multidrug transport system ATPase subunit
MPQEITLYREFNISETLNFFGMLHKMKKGDIEARKEFLLEFLNLPPPNKLVKNLR